MKPSWILIRTIYAFDFSFIRLIAWPRMGQLELQFFDFGAFSLFGEKKIWKKISQTFPQQKSFDPFPKFFVLPVNSEKESFFDFNFRFRFEFRKHFRPKQRLFSVFQLKGNFFNCVRNIWKKYIVILFHKKSFLFLLPKRFFSPES